MNDDYSRFTAPPGAPAAPQPAAETKTNADADLIAAVKAGAEDSVKSLLKKGANANAKEEKSGLSVLTLAINKGNPPEVEALIAAGADVNERDAKNRTRLEHAIDKYMVARFVRTSFSDKHAATYAKRVAALIANAAKIDVGAKSSYGNDLAGYARKAGLTEIADALAQKIAQAQQGIAGRSGTVE